MLDPQTVLLFLGAYATKVRKFDYKRLIPRGRVDKYAYAAAGIEITWPWGKEGLGIGFGLGVIDFWVGWPHLEESLHIEGCRHAPVEAPVKSKEL